MPATPVLMKRRKGPVKFVLCIRNKDCDDLTARKVYRVLPDEDTAGEGYLRVVDDSNEDYLYPAKFFVPIEVPESAAKALSK